MPRCSRPFPRSTRHSRSTAWSVSATPLPQQTATATFGADPPGSFSVGTLLLAAIGLYGLVAYVVGLSRREIAVRLALGATQGTVTRLVVRNGLTLVDGGVTGRSCGCDGGGTFARSAAVSNTGHGSGDLRSCRSYRWSSSRSSPARCRRGEQCGWIPTRPCAPIRGAFLFVLVLVELVAPGARLRTGDDAGDVGILARRRRHRVYWRVAPCSLRGGGPFPAGVPAARARAPASVA